MKYLLAIPFSSLLITPLPHPPSAPLITLPLSSKLPLIPYLFLVYHRSLILIYISLLLPSSTIFFSLLYCFPLFTTPTQEFIEGKETDGGWINLDARLSVTEAWLKRQMHWDPHWPVGGGDGGGGGGVVIGGECFLLLLWWWWWWWRYKQSSYWNKYMWVSICLTEGVVLLWRVMEDIIIRKQYTCICISPMAWLPFRTSHSTGRWW